MRNNDRSGREAQTKVDWDRPHRARDLAHQVSTNGYGRERYKVLGEPTTADDAAQLAKDDPYQFQWWALGLIGARPTEGKKGADHGIDGRLFFFDEGSKPKQIIVSVKAGKVQVSHVRDLVGVLDREKAQLGVVISFQEPTQPMRAEAASAGFYKSLWGSHSRVQLLTVAELLDGARIDMPAAGPGALRSRCHRRLKKSSILTRCRLAPSLHPTRIAVGWFAALARFPLRDMAAR